jgi:hypothetical protein
MSSTYGAGSVLRAAGAGIDSKVSNLLLGSSGPGTGVAGMGLSTSLHAPPHQLPSMRDVRVCLGRRVWVWVWVW